MLGFVLGLIIGAVPLAILYRRTLALHELDRSEAFDSGVKVGEQREKGRQRMAMIRTWKGQEI